MRRLFLKPPVGAGFVALLAALVVSGVSWAQEEIEPPDPGVPQIFTIQGQYVRVAYNTEGYAVLGYRLANLSVGEEWMRLEVGLTILQLRGEKPYMLKRDAISLSTPDGKELPLPSSAEFRKADLRALERRAAITRDPINYFPPGTTRPCELRFFVALDEPGIPFDQVELSSQRGCVGRLFFDIPGGIQYGQHWLNIKFANSLVRVPFRILTEEEAKEFSKSWKDIKKELDDWTQDELKKLQEKAKKQ
jgi:hypothetical protein